MMKRFQPLLSISTCGRYNKDLDKEMADNVSRDREQRAAVGGVEARVVGLDASVADLFAKNEVWG